ncbi:hypothetical protein [Paractinoplanes toevensis]|uniref:hypothetical protein n=1 Tax=Paractinoplanes toevensis TaxID=571911 RepID=UPI001BB405F6|nr:hypothetical protein [Actinoplanes toevensis]
MQIHSPKTVLSRPRPEACRSGRNSPGSGGEGGNTSSRLAAMIGPNGLLAAALLLSAILVGLATVALNSA